MFEKLEVWVERVVGNPRQGGSCTDDGHEEMCRRWLVVTTKRDFALCVCVRVSSGNEHKEAMASYRDICVSRTGQNRVHSLFWHIFAPSVKPEQIGWAFATQVWIQTKQTHTHILRHYLRGPKTWWAGGHIHSIVPHMFYLLWSLFQAPMSSEWVGQSSSRSFALRFIPSDDLSPALSLSIP